jgi:hypothetical protein
MIIPPEVEAQILRLHHVEKWRYAARGMAPYMPCAELCRWSLDHPLAVAI